MNPAQVFSLAYLGGVLVGYVAGALLPWWLAGMPCYLAAGVTALGCRACNLPPVERHANVNGLLFGACGAATAVAGICTRPHAPGVVDGCDPCVVPLLVGLIYACDVWHDETSPPRFPATVRQVWALGFGLYVITCALAWAMVAT